MKLKTFIICLISIALSLTVFDFYQKSIWKKPFIQNFKGSTLSFSENYNEEYPILIATIYDCYLPLLKIETKNDAGLLAKEINKRMNVENEYKEITIKLISHNDSIKILTPSNTISGVDSFYTVDVEFNFIIGKDI